LSNILLSRLTSYADKTTGDHQCEFQHNQLLIRYSAFVRYWRKNGSTMRLYIRLQERLYDSVRREEFYSILIELSIPMKLCLFN
jgi:hypothetical protein